MEELDELIHTYYRALQCDQTLVYKKPKKEEQEQEQALVTVYGQSRCPYCRKAKTLVEDRPNAIYIEMDADFTPRTPAHTPHIETSKTIPVVFVNDDHIGGLTELEKLFTE